MTREICCQYLSPNSCAHIQFPFSYIHFFFPSKMQIAKVVMLYKKGNYDELGNYRPASVLPILSKAFEKLKHIRISNFVETYKPLTECQFGFRKNKSTELALLQQKEYILT